MGNALQSLVVFLNKLNILPKTAALGNLAFAKYTLMNINNHLIFALYSNQGPS